MPFTAVLTTEGKVATISLSGVLDAASDDVFEEKVERAATLAVDQLVLDATHLQQLTAAGVRALTYARQRMPDDVEVVVTSPSAAVRQALEAADLDDAVAIRE